MYRKDKIRIFGLGRGGAAMHRMGATVRDEVDRIKGKAEVVLKGQDWIRFCMLRDLSGCSSAEYVRRAVLSENVGEMRRFNETIGGLMVSVNALTASLDAGQGLDDQARADMGRKIRQVRDLFEDIISSTIERGIL